MTRDNGNQPTRLTVAELLAQHGAPLGEGTRRRHRRRDEAGEADEADVATTAPQAIIERVQSESPRTERPTRRNGHGLPQPPAPPAPAPETDSAPTRIERQPEPTPPPPPPARQRAPFTESATDEFEAVADIAPSTWRSDTSPDVEDDLEDDYYPDAEYDDHQAELTALEREQAEHDASARKQWLAVAAQLALGVAGGATVWLLFNWLWTRTPAFALAAALLVIVGLVWIVRKIRKADDLQSTVLAVLVGLVVTVSPAALLLLSR